MIAYTSQGLALPSSLEPSKRLNEAMDVSEDEYKKYHAFYR
jgi:hypothetical protein